MEAPRPGVEEREMTDEELLGEATLAKIAPKPALKRSTSIARVAVA